MRGDVPDFGPVRWFRRETASDERLGAFAHPRRLRKRVRVGSDALVRGVHVRRLKRRRAHEQRVQNHPDRPHVHLVRVPASLTPRQNFWRDVIGRPADGRLSLVVSLEPTREAEIANLQSPARRGFFEVGVRARSRARLVESRGGEEEISEFEIAVDDAVGVEVRDGGDDLARVTRDFALGQTAALFDDVCERLVAAELHEDVDVGGVFETPDETDDVRVGDAAVDANLGEDLLARAFLLERRLGHHLGGEGFARGGILHRVHHREAALAEGSTADVRAGLGLAGVVEVTLRDDARAFHLLGAVADRARGMEG